MAKHRPSSGNSIVDAIGAIILLLFLLWLFWMFFHQQIITAVTNFLIGLAELILIAIVLIVGGYVGFKLEENNTISSGWGLIVGVIIFIVVSALQLGLIGGVIVLLDIGALIAFAWKYLDQLQYSGGLLR